MPDLFGNITENNPWQKEWQDMPEFIQEDKWEYQQIIVRFENEQDVADFSKLIGQNILPTTQSIWFPKISDENKTIGRDKTKRYIDEP